MIVRWLVVCLAAGLGWVDMPGSVYAQTAQGEIQGRAAPVALRRCVSGASAGQLCNESSDCPGSSCPDRNVINLSVAVHYNASAADLTAIRNLISAGSAVLFDATDGQAQIGSATIHNNAFGTNADVRIYPSSNPTWWQADTGQFKTGGSVHVSIDNVLAAGAGGESLAHELVHLIFDARDEYESRTVGCGAATSGFTCPDSAAIASSETACLMDQGGIVSGGPHTELCWGQGDPSNLTDISAGNHDANDVTEQSRCRSNRSCWDQVVWSFPDVIKKPAAAPDPGANGLLVNPTSFINTSTVNRVVLVLDESGSMALESPTRMARLKVAAKDFVNLAESGTELGIVSFSDDAEPGSGRVLVNIAALGANRSAWINAIDGMAPANMTNIGAGLQKGSDLITAAGGVTGNTFIVLMTDGLNNQPPPQATAAADLQSKLAALLSAGVPVFVTCTGSDLGLSSQCAEIASATNGFYVDSRDASELQPSFVELSERAARREPIDERSGTFKSFGSPAVWVEKGSESATFTLVWDAANVSAGMTAISPSGVAYQSLGMPQGRYVRVKSPESGNWTFRVDASADVPYRLRAFSRNQYQSMNVGLRRASVAPGDPLTVYAYPRSFGGAISNKSEGLLVTVRRPDGTEDKLTLFDTGRVGGLPDDIDDDGIFTGVYADTKLEGAYTFSVLLDAEGWPQSGDFPEAQRDPGLKNPRLRRLVKISAAVVDRTHVETSPEDDIAGCPQGCRRDKACAPGKFRYAQACSRTCPNGSPAVNGQCLVPVDADGRANCVNEDPKNCPPDTQLSLDCRVYNLEARDEKGQLCKDASGKPLCRTTQCAPPKTLPATTQVKSLRQLGAAMLPVGMLGLGALLVRRTRRTRS